MPKKMTAAARTRKPGQSIEKSAEISIAPSKQAKPKRLKTTAGLAKAKVALQTPSNAAAVASPLPQAASVIALDLPPAALDAATKAYFDKCIEKIGYVPNVLLAYAFDLPKLNAFAAMYNDLMLAPSGLSKLEREMIAVAVSAVNRCYYCLTAHGAAVRSLSGTPELGEQIVMNYRAARLDPRQRALLDFAVKLTETPHAVEEADRAALRAVGFSDRDIWDAAAVTAFFNMSNRVATATDMRPNPEYLTQARTPAG